MSAGLGAMLEGNLAEATAALTESAKAFREADAPVLITALIVLGEIALRAGDAPGAAGRLREGLRTARATGYRRNVAEGLLDFGILARAVGQPERSARLLGAAEALRGELNLQITVRQRRSYEETQSAVQATLGESRFKQAWAEGLAMTPEQAVAYALEEDGG